MLGKIARVLLCLYFSGVMKSAPARASLLDQKLETLYRTISEKFANNPYFKNRNHPLLADSEIGTTLPEYTLPSLALFKTAMKSYCALMDSAEGNRVSRPDHFTLVNYSEPALHRRMYVFDLRKQEVLHVTWATHGDRSILDLSLSLKDTDFGEEQAVFSESDLNTSSYFTNTPETSQSSVGMAIHQGNTYDSPSFGSTAVRLEGIDGDLNSNLLDRSVVVHAFDYSTLDFTRHSIPLSEGCLMLPRVDHYQGKKNQAVSDTIIQDLTGSPILLYSERMKPEQNEKEHRKQLALLLKFQMRLEENFEKLARQHQWSPSAAKKYLAQVSEKLKDKLLPRIEATWQYFRTPSKYLGKELKLDEKCLNSLLLTR